MEFERFRHLSDDERDDIYRARKKVEEIGTFIHELQTLGGK
jgi:hypothetical protein